MKILLIHNKYQQAGGEDVAVKEELLLLQQKGHTSEVIYFDNTDIDNTFSKIKSGLRSFYNKQSYAVIANKIHNYKPDVIHLHNFFFTASPSVLYAAAKNNIPVVATVENYRLICANALLMRHHKPCELCVNKTFPIHGIINRCYRSSSIESALVTAITGFHKVAGTWRKKIDQYITPTSFAKEKLLHSSLHLSAEQICVKPNFIADCGEGMNPREDFFLFAGRLSAEKGIDVLLRSFTQLPGLKLMIAGSGPDEQALREQYKSFPNITFTGRKSRDEIILLMQTCRALIFPSIWYEGLPYTIIEAFATGTPVIASKLGAMESLITHNFNGLHFTPGSSNDLCSAVTAFHTLADHGASFYKNARLTYLENYHPDIHYKEIMKIYNNVISRKL